MTNIGPMTSSDLVTKREAAEMLGMTPSAVNKMVLAGKLRPSRAIPGRKRSTAMYLFRRADVERLVARRAVAS